HNGIPRVLLAAGHMADVLADYLATRPPDGLDITLSREPEPLGTGGALKFVEPRLNSDPVLVLNGDSLVPHLEFSTLWKTSFHTVENYPEECPRDGKLSAAFSTLWKTSFHGVENRAGFFHAMEKHCPHHGKLFVTPIAEASRFGTVEFDEDGVVTAFREKAERACGFVNAGAYLLTRDIISTIAARTVVSLETEVFPALVRNRRLLALPCPPPLLDMGTPAGLDTMERFLRG
ncbi:MAG: sugar phosphate nucleotidyltransferase, partial [Kiritimatiellia bacterium]|nr:sugar phosphate nucleotidyltransferase [Kiritimatiellia bacterium]